MGLLAAAGAHLGAAATAAADDAAAVARHGAAVSAANALIAEVRVSLTRAARVFVEYDNPQAGRYRTALSEPGVEHRIPIVRLRPQTTYDYTIFAAGARGPGGSFTTGRLPPAFDDLTVKVSGRSSLPLIVTNYYRKYYVMWDELGSPVWYYDQVARPSVIRQLPGGNFVLLNQGLTEITPLGEVVNRFARRGADGTPHHDVTVLEDGRVLYFSRQAVVFDDSVNGGAEETVFMVDQLRVWRRERGRSEQVWDARETWDILDPKQRVIDPAADDGPYRWTQLNTVTIGRRGNVILTSRRRHQVVSLSPDLRSVEWQLSGPDSDYEFPHPADRFYGPHTASQLANGNILLFDNGWTRPEAEGGPYSRALELRLDAAAGAAVKVWEYRPAPDLYAPRFGSAYRLANGNTLVNFSTVEERRVDAPLTVVEVAPDGREVFRVETLAARFPPERGRYRAAGGVRAIMGETMLRPPAGPAPEARRQPAADGFAAPARVRELAAAAAGAQRVARGPFDLYLGGGRLLYARENCALDDVTARFFLHAYPAAADAGGFEVLDFRFSERGLVWGGVCLAEATLPDHALGRLVTGQFRDGTALWKAEIAAPGGGNGAD